MIFGRVQAQMSSNIQWKTYTDDKIGYSIEYPSNWNVIPQNISYKGSKTAIESPYTSSKNSGKLDIFSSSENVNNTIEYFIKQYRDNLLYILRFDGINAKIIEDISTSKYGLDKDKASSFSVEINSLSSIPHTTEYIGVFHNGKVYLFQYTALSNNFETPENFNIRTHMIKSIKWITPLIVDTPPDDFQSKYDNSTVINNNASLECGQTVYENVKLTENIKCRGIGLFIAKDGLTIDLNGFNITSSGSNPFKIGIFLGGKTNVHIIGNGFISGFNSGVNIENGQNISISNINFRNNTYGILTYNSTGLKITHNQLSNNTYAISTNNDKLIAMERNSLDHNQFGVLFIYTNSSIFKNNNISDSERALSFDTSNGNKISLNRFSKNSIDINNSIGLTSNQNSNNFSNNICRDSIPPAICKG